MEKGAAKQAMQKAKEKHVQGPMGKGMEKGMEQMVQQPMEKDTEKHIKIARQAYSMLNA